jgi:hypothetical protein
MNVFGAITLAPRIACALVVIAVAGAIRAMFITKEYGYGLLGSLEAHENPKPADGGHVDLLRS